LNATAASAGPGGAGTSARSAAAARNGFAITLVAFAILLGAFMASALNAYKVDAAPPAWGEARWIAPAVPAAVAYYRVEFTLAAKPTHAVLQLAAPDSFTAYVNGTQLGTSTFASVNTFDLLDLGATLQPGRNVIAVRVGRRTYPGTAGLLARVLWRDDAGGSGAVETGAEWRTSPREEHQIDGTVLWYSPDFHAEEWAHADVQADPAGPVHPVHPWADASLFEAFPSGNWIWSGNATPLGVTFRRNFELGAGGIRHAWLGVASRGPYTLVINRTSAIAVPVSTGFMDVYDIGPLLSPGSNGIEIDTSNIG